MNKIILGLTLLASLTCLALGTESYNLEVNGGGEIRIGGFFSSDPTFIPFREEVVKELAKKNISSNSKNVIDGNLEYDYEFITQRFDFFGLRHKAKINGELIFNGQSSQFSFICDALIADGGNQTLKISCAQALAKKVQKLISN